MRSLFKCLLIFQLAHFTYTQTSYPPKTEDPRDRTSTRDWRTTPREWTTTRDWRTTPQEWSTTRYYQSSTYPPTTFRTLSTRNWRTTPLTEFHRRFNTLENNLKEIKSRLLSDCEKMDSRPVLAKECYEEVETIIDLEVELKTTRVLDELTLVERQLEQIVIKVDRIEKDLNE